MVVRLRSRDVRATPGVGDRTVYARRAAMPRLGVCAGRRRRGRPNGSAERPREYASASTVRYLPLVVGATLMVAVVPVVASLSLRAFGVISSPWLSMALAGALSFVASVSASACWRKRKGQAELLFSELLLWGWVRRWRQDRKLAEAAALLGLGASARPAGDQPLRAAHEGQLLTQLAHALELQDRYLRGHSRRVARHAAMIAQRMGLADDEVDRIRVAAVVHDVGKLRTPPEILNRPSPLGDAEFDEIRRHPVDGADMTAVLDDPQLTAIVRHHHERVDGTGYPDHLCGEAIPLGARIIAVADTFDAVTSTRAYRSAAQHSQAIDILRDSAGSQLDPAAVRAFVGYYSSNRMALSWAIASATLRRAISWLNGDPVAAAPVFSGKFAAAAVVTAAIGSATAVAPIAAVNASAMLAAAPTVTEQPGQFGVGWPAQHRGQPAASNQQRQSAAANSLALVPAWMSSPHGQAGALRGAAFPPIGPPPLVPVNSSSLLAPTPNLAATFFAPPSLTPSSNTTPTSAAGLTNPLPGTSSASSTENPPATAQPSPRPQPNTHRPSGPETGNRSANPHGTGQGSSHANAGPNNPGNAYGHGQANPSGQGNAYGQGNGGGQANPSGQGNAYGQGNGGGQADPSGQGNAYGQGNGGGQANPSGQGNAYGQGNGGGQANPSGQGNAYGQGNGGGQANPSGQGNAYGQGNGGGQANPSGQGNAHGQGNRAGHDTANA